MNVSIVGCRRQAARLMACALSLMLAAPVSLAADHTLPDAPQPAATSPQNASQSQTNAAQSSASNGQSPGAQPVGTAVAPVMKPVGVAASEPAGAAIAPAKQRRIRVLAIRWGLILGGAIALGTVAAATLGSPRRPN